MRNKTIGYEETKKLLNKLRSLNESIKSKKTPINEQESDDILVVNDVEVKMVSSDKDDMGLKDDQKESISQLIDNFRQQVSQIVELDPGITMNEKQIRMDGTLTDQDISFVFIVGEENGLYLNADMLKVEQETLEIIQKLQKFEDVYKTSMEPLLSQRSNN
jgi:hypothetical protein